MVHVPVAGLPPALAGTDHFSIYVRTTLLTFLPICPLLGFPGRKRYGTAVATNGFRYLWAFKTMCLLILLRSCLRSCSALETLVVLWTPVSEIQLQSIQPNHWKSITSFLLFHFFVFCLVCLFVCFWFVGFFFFGRGGGGVQLFWKTNCLCVPAPVIPLHTVLRMCTYI